MKHVVLHTTEGRKVYRSRVLAPTGVGERGETYVLEYLRTLPKRGKDTSIRMTDDEAAGDKPRYAYL
jgi:hypothetical protein